tara:strand:+ start:4809 stop:5252 length:444 start_codon:yes stop_codon:yes gene_type:complete
MKYEILVILIIFIILYNLKSKKEPFVKPRNGKKLLLVDDNGNIETMSMNELYNAMEDLKKEVFAHIEKRKNESINHSNGVKKWVKQHYETKGCIRNHGRVHLLGQGNPCRGLRQRGNDLDSKQVETEHAGTGKRCRNDKAWWRIIQR